MNKFGFKQNKKNWLKCKFAPFWHQVVGGGAFWMWQQSNGKEGGKKPKGKWKEEVRNGFSDNGWKKKSCSGVADLESLFYRIDYLEIKIVMSSFKDEAKTTPLCTNNKWNHTLAQN